MILFLDTSTPICHLILVQDSQRFNSSWEAGRSLAHDLLKYMETQLANHDFTWSDVSGIGIFQGPGSFTGLRIGMTVANTLAESLQIPIVGATSDDWVDQALMRLSNDENDYIVLPFYGAEANVTKPRK